MNLLLRPLFPALRVQREAALDEHVARLRQGGASWDEVAERTGLEPGEAERRHAAARAHVPVHGIKSRYGAARRA